MKQVIQVCLIALGLSSVVVAQNSAPPLQQQGAHVQLPALSRATAMPQADQPDATVVTVTAEGNVYVGADPVGIDALAGLRASVVYVKADAQASYQQVLTILSALNAHQLVLLTEPTTKAGSGKITPPYGVSVVVGGH